MRKKLFATILSVAVAVSMVLPFSVSAASAMSATAKAGDAVVDGTVSEGEYGDAFEMNADNTMTWAELSALSSPITYRFAWSEKGLYVAISYADSLDGGSQIQINCNPGGQLSADQQGLFVTIQPSGTVMLHNHSTALASLEGDATLVDVTSKVTVASSSADGTKTTEVFLPIDAFRITDTDFTFSAGEMACSAFAVIMKDGAAAEVAAAISGQITDWHIGTLGFGTLTLEAAAEDETPGEPSAPTTAPSDNDNPGTADSDWLIPAVCVAVLAAAVFVIVCRKTRIKV
ncbi:MAG TPA: hypothetical protein IAD50_01415 [Candidatus Egerieisoma faecipullorum]|uniref:Carbohydrate-binding domain-containing protein n=1 Tax=Candidatus Egerieisoma faecipullorum TaxID=2840963 RepID=A0A9D1I5T9_9CLOT|nr:hypothetical protein [Candidatus Egerieisoma faecipullorum]